MSTLCEKEIRFKYSTGTFKSFANILSTISMAVETNVYALKLFSSSSSSAKLKRTFNGDYKKEGKSVSVLRNLIGKVLQMISMKFTIWSNIHLVQTEL